MPATPPKKKPKVSLIARIVTTIRIPADLLEKVDAAAIEHGMSRTKFFEHTLRVYLSRIRRA